MSSSKRFALVVVALGAVSISAALAIRSYQRKRRPLQLMGAIVRQNVDPSKQSPIADVQVTATSNGAVVATAKSDFFGDFALRLPRGIVEGDSITLRFRDPAYQPLDETQTVADTLNVVQLVPLHGEVEADLDPSAVPIANIQVRYSTQTSAVASIGTEAKTFQVMNHGNEPCVRTSPCSPDRKWKAAVASASMDAGEGNVFRNARAFCIAGPCPFTRIDTDNFSHGGRKISIAVRDWSNTTTFLLQAEVMHSQTSDIERRSYPLIFGREMDFTVPGDAEGTSIEAEINGSETIFPLGPSAQLDWADCKVKQQSNRIEDFRCELKRGFRFPANNESAEPRVVNKSGS